MSIGSRKVRARCRSRSIRSTKPKILCLVCCCCVCWFLIGPLKHAVTCFSLPPLNTRRRLPTDDGARLIVGIDVNVFANYQSTSTCATTPTARRQGRRRTLSALFVAARKQGDIIAIKAPHQAAATTTSRSVQDLKKCFVAQLEASLQDGTFVSFALQGPTAHLKNKNKKASKPSDNQQLLLLENEDFLRGCIKQIQGRRIQLKNNRHFLQVTFKYHGATDIAKNWPLDTTTQQQQQQDDATSGNKLHEALTSVVNFPSSIGSTSHNDNDNYVPVSEWGHQQFAVANSQADDIIVDMETFQRLVGIQRGVLTTTDYSLELDIGYSTKKPRLKQKQQSKSKIKQQQQQQQQQQADGPVVVAAHHHDRVKQVPLDSKADFLRALGVTDVNGKPKQAMASKLRQCQKFVEIVGNLVDRATTNSITGTSTTRTSSSSSDRSSPTLSHIISVLDMGCGRGYLTFSLHSHLQSKFRNTNNTKVNSMGIDVRPKLVAEINGIAESLGPDFAGLHFEQGSIENVMLATTTASARKTSSSSSSPPPPSSLDILIALHACDTATDDALWCGISRRANIIVVAPCCHKQLRPQLNAHMTSMTTSSSHNNNQHHHPLTDILRHAVYRERHAETVTDSMRALLLELAGYQVQVFEFIGGEHTAKNVMITAVQSWSTENDNSNNDDSSSNNNNNNNGNHDDDDDETLLPFRISKSKQKELQSRLEDLACLHGIRQQRLAQWMGEMYLGDKSSLLSGSSESGGTKRIKHGNMPPL